MQNLNLQLDESDPYAHLIRGFIVRQFPNKFQTGVSLLLDIITDAIVASKEVRYGPRPSPESLVAMRQVISRWTALGLPIPFLIPSGSEKPDGSGIDVAELAMLKTIACLQDRIKRHYSPGAVFNIRLEDASAPYLFYDRAEQARKDAALYTDGLVRLVKIFGFNFINPRPESYGTTESALNAKADTILPAMELHLLALDDPKPIAALKALGWDKPVSPETAQYYLDGYDRLYPGMEHYKKIHTLARYLSVALARNQLGVGGSSPEWDKNYLEVYFGQTPPGLDPSRYLRRIHYRTLPSSITSQHVPPWRSKGYLCVSADRATAKLASFREEREYNPYVLQFERGGIKQEVRADYILK